MGAEGGGRGGRGERERKRERERESEREGEALKTVSRAVTVVCRGGCWLGVWEWGGLYEGTSVRACGLRDSPLPPKTHIFSVCADIIGRLRVVSTFGQPFTDGAAVGGGAVHLATLETGGGRRAVGQKG